MSNTQAEWAEPGAWEVAPGIYRIPLPLPGDALKAINVYLVRGPGHLAMIDSGWHGESSWDTLQAALRTVGADVGDIRQLLVTHIHYDHYGQAPRIRRVSGASVSLGVGERLSLESLIAQPSAGRRLQNEMLRAHGAEDLARRLSESEGPGGATNRVLERPDAYLVDGQLLTVGERTLEVIATPGHTTGHVVFVDGQSRILFAGDHILPHITPSIGIERLGAPLALASFMSSLRKIRDCSIDLVFPAHGPPFTGLRQRVDELLEHHQRRLQAALAEVDLGASTAMAVAAALPWTRRSKRFNDLDAANQVLAVRETVAHLEVLVADGLITRDVRDERTTYRSRSDGDHGPSPPRAISC